MYTKEDFQAILDQVEDNIKNAHGEEQTAYFEGQKGLLENLIDDFDKSPEECSES
jgi:hypothetical protein